MDLSIITVTWNSEDTITDQLRSVISACDGLEFEQIVVDNNSNDRTVEIIKENFGDVKIIENKNNLGFGRANNQGYGIARGKYILFLNPDMKFSSGSLRELLNWMDNDEKAVIAGMRLLNSDNEDNKAALPRRSPRLRDVLYIFIKLSKIFPSLLDKYLYRDKKFDGVTEVGTVRGSAMFTKKSFLDDVGHAFDERFFIWFEDVDICREAYFRGYKVFYYPGVAFIDLVGHSFKKRNFFWKQLNFFSSSLKYFLKWK